MNHTLDLLDQLRQRNISLWLDNGRLRYRAPKDALSPELLTALKTHKAEVIAFLQKATTHHKNLHPPIQVIDRQQKLPLSFAQQRLWFLQKLEPDSISNNMPVALHFEGQLNIGVLKQSVFEVVRRHEVLRTRFPAVKNQPTAVVEQQIEIELPIVDLRCFPSHERTFEAHRQATEAARQPFDLETGPIFHLKLFWIEDSEFLLIWNMHSIICDDASSDVVYQDLTTTYQAMVAGSALPLSTIPVQYIDFAHWQREWLQGDVLETPLSYWKQTLAGHLPSIQLPFDHPKPSGKQSYRGDRASHIFSPQLQQALIELSQKSDTTLFMTLLSAFEILLYRYSMQEDLLINVASTGRGNVETEGLLGFFSNTLPLRADLSGKPTFREVLRRVKQSALQAFTHQDIPFERIVEELQPEQRQSQSSLFQIKFALNPPWSKDRGMAAVHLPGLSIKPLPDHIYHNKTKYDITLVMREQDEGLGMFFDYNAELFETDTMARMVEHFQTLLEGIISNPDQYISKLPLLTATEQEKFQQHLHAPPLQQTEPTTVEIHRLFEQQVTQHAEKVALCLASPDSGLKNSSGKNQYLSDQRQLTYQNLNMQANQLAHYLQSNGVSEATPVVICLEKSPIQIVAQLAVLKAGGIYIPLNADVSASALSRICSDVQSSILLTQKSIADRVNADSKTVICLDMQQDAIQRHNPDNLCCSSPEVACILYPDPTTEKLTGVNLTHRGITHLSHRIKQLQTSPLETILHFAAPTSSIGIFEVFTALLNGSQLSLPKSNLKQAELGTTIRQHHVTMVYLPTRLFNSLIENDFESLVSLQTCLIGGDIASLYHTQKFLKSFPQCALFNTYCADENTGLVSLQRITEPISTQTANRIGSPVSGTQTYILDKNQQPVPIGVEGDLYFTGAQLAKVSSENSQSHFILNPFLPKESQVQGLKYLFRTGRRAKYLSDGSVILQGNENASVVHGVPLKLCDVEIILSLHPLIKECKILEVRDDNDGTSQLVAYVIATQQSLKSQSLHDFLKRRLPLHMVPSNFVILEAFPLNRQGGIELEQLPLPLSAQWDFEDVQVAAQSQIELKLAEIWQEVLKVDTVRITDNFFEIGGNSLLAMNLAIKIQEKLSKTLPLASFFEAPTIRELADVLQQDTPQSEWHSLVPIQAKGERPPLFFVHFVLRSLTNCLASDQPVYALRYGIAAQTNDCHQEIPSRVEDLAAHYIQEMQRIQPAGPYYLMGASFGGTIAFEMARQLVKQGEVVDLLAVFDTSLWDRPNKYSAFQQWQQKFLKKLKSGLPGLQHSVRYRLSKLNYYRKYKGEYTPHVNWDQEVRIFDPYTPQFYSGKVTLFNAIDQADQYDDPNWLSSQWLQISQEVQTFDVPGGHTGLLAEPHVTVVANILNECLQTNGKSCRQFVAK